MKKYFLALVVLLSAVQHIRAQKPALTFENISTSQGLSINNATCILQDQKGFIWIGTRDGLNKYDGYKFTIYRNNPEDPSSIGGNFIWSMTEDKQGNLWIGTVEGGLNKYEWQGDKFIRYTNDPHKPSGISHNTVQSILEDSRGNLWTGTANGLDLLDRKKNTFIHYRHNPGNPASLADNNIYKVFEDSKGNLWIGTRNGGLDLFDRERNNFRHFQYDSANERSISENAILSIYEDHEGDLWVGTDSKGVNLLDRKTNSFSRFRHDPDNPNSLSNNTVRCINEDDKGFIWLGTENGGISLYDKKKKVFYRYQQDDKYAFGMSSNSLWDICKDRKGNVWLATFGGGVDFLDKEPAKFVCYKKEPNNNNSLSHNNVTTFWEDDKGHIWIGTDGGGITVFDRENNQFRHYRHQQASTSLVSDVVLTIKQGRSKEFLAGTFRGGLSLLKDPATGVFYKFPIDTAGNHGTSSGMIGNLVEDKQGNWWVGTWQGGLNYYDRQNKTFTRYKPDPNDPASFSALSVQSLLLDSKENLWIGTMGGGLNLLDKATNRFIHYKHEDGDPRSLSNDVVNCILEDSTGRLWIGTNNGLNLFDPVTRTFAKYFQKDGLPNNVIESILEDGKANLWIGTNNGLSRFNPAAKTFLNYNLNDGLQGTVFNHGACLKTAKGEMLFGGSGGFNIFNPDSIRANTFIPPVFITDLQLFNKSVKPGGKDSILKTHINEARELTLSYKQSVFSFEFAALNYTLQEKNQYAYKLEGFDKEWNMVGTQRKATYTNLDPGEYVFRVKASNNDGVWNEKGASIKLIITPPFWATWWFRLLVVLFIAGSAIAFYKFRMRAIEKQKKELERRVEELDKAVAQGKFEIASDVLHDIGNAMVGFGSYLTRITRLQQQEQPENLEKLAGFFESQQPAMATVIGEAKSGAVVKMLSGIAQTQKTNQEEIRKSITEQLNIITHIQEILDIQRQYITGKETRERKPVNIRSVINDCMSMLFSSIDKKAIAVALDIPLELPLIKGDRTKLMQLLLSVLKNSIEAIDPQASEKNLSLRANRQDGLLILEIRDNGSGFDEATAYRLFERGFTTKVSGAGLALYNCREIVESHSGTIDISSKGLGEGSLTMIRFNI